MGVAVVLPTSCRRGYGNFALSDREGAVDVSYVVVPCNGNAVFVIYGDFDCVGNRAGIYKRGRKNERLSVTVGKSVADYRIAVEIAFGERFCIVNFNSVGRINRDFSL